MDEVIFKIQIHILEYEYKCSSQSKVKIPLMLSSFNETQTLEACSSMLTNNTNKPYNMIEIKAKRPEDNHQKKQSSSVPCQVTSISKEAFHIEFILFMIFSSSILYVKLHDHACWSPDLLSIHLLLNHDFNITYFHKPFILPYSITPHLNLETEKK